MLLLDWLFWLLDWLLDWLFWLLDWLLDWLFWLLESLPCELEVFVELLVSASRDGGSLTILACPMIGLAGDAAREGNGEMLRCLDDRGAVIGLPVKMLASCEVSADAKKLPIVVWLSCVRSSSWP